MVHSSRWYMKVSSAFSFTLGCYIEFGDDLDGAVRTSQLAGCTAGAGMFIVSSCGITTSPRKRSGKTSVSRLSGYCWVMISLGRHEVPSRRAHAFPQRTYGAKYFRYILFNERHFHF